MGSTFLALSEAGLTWNPQPEATVGLSSGQLPLLLRLLGVPRGVPAPGRLLLAPQNPASVVPKTSSLLLPELRAQRCRVWLLCSGCGFPHPFLPLDHEFSRDKD